MWCYNIIYYYTHFVIIFEVLIGLFTSLTQVGVFAADINLNAYAFSRKQILSPYEVKCLNVCGNYMTSFNTYPEPEFQIRII